MTRVTELVPFRPHHRYELVESTQSGSCDPSDDLWRDVADQGASVTLRIDGRTVLCGGVVQLEDGEHLAWAAIDELSRRHAVAIHRVARRVLKAAVAAVGRVLAHVVWDGFPEGHRWVEALGFRRVSIRRGLRPDDRLTAVYALEAD